LITNYCPVLPASDEHRHHIIRATNDDRLRTVLVFVRRSTVGCIRPLRNTTIDCARYCITTSIDCSPQYDDTNCTVRRRSTAPRYSLHDTPSCAGTRKRSNDSSTIQIQYKYLYANERYCPIRRTIRFHRAIRTTERYNTRRYLYRLPTTKRTNESKRYDTIRYGTDEQKKHTSNIKIL
jgi:hypothetical protein